MIIVGIGIDSELASPSTFSNSPMQQAWLA